MVIVPLLLLLAGIPLPQAPVRYVTDHAGVLPLERADALETKLANFDKATSNQVIVYIEQFVPEGTTLEEMGAEAIRTWGVGQKGQDNGVILFVFTESRKMRIEVGYGLEGTLTDAKSAEILNQVIRPYLRDGDYPGAVEQGVEAITAVIAPGYSFAPTPAPEPVAALPPGDLPTASANNGRDGFNDGLFLVFILVFLGVMLLIKKMYGEPDAVQVDDTGSLRPRERWFFFDNNNSPNSASHQSWTASSGTSSSWADRSSGSSWGGSSGSWSSGDSSSGGSSSGSSSSGGPAGGFTGGGGSGGGGGASGSW